MVCRWNDTHDYGHQRIEEREYTILPTMYFLKHKKILEPWRDLTAIVRVKAKRTFLDKNKQEETAGRYYITSMPFNKYQKICEVIRAHWSVESKLHYKLDVGFHEDDCQIFRGFAD